MLFPTSEFTHHRFGVWLTAAWRRLQPPRIESGGNPTELLMSDSPGWFFRNVCLSRVGSFDYKHISTANEVQLLFLVCLCFCFKRKFILVAQKNKTKLNCLGYCSRKRKSKLSGFFLFCSHPDLENVTFKTLLYFQPVQSGMCS